MGTIMVAPVFDLPLTITYSNGSPPKLSRERQWSRQGKPYNLNLGWISRRYEWVSSSDGNGSYGGGLGFYTNVHTWSYNKAYEKLVSQLNNNSMWAVNLAEQNQSLNMIINRAHMLREFIRDLRKLRFAEAAATLRFYTVPKGVSKSKSLANNFLEYHFGWEPLLNDIYAAVETFLDPHLPGYRPVRGKGSARDGTHVAPDYANFVSGGTTRESSKTTIGCDIAITNHNARLATELGLVNPLSVAWELVPFSFVVDWFVNVGQVLSSYTDFAGLQTSGEFVTTLDVNYSTTLTYFGYESNYVTVLCSRSVGSIPGPTLKVKQFKGLSPVRGITAIALLVQSTRK